MGALHIIYTCSIGPVSIDPSRFDPAEIANNSLYMPDDVAATQQTVNKSGEEIDINIHGRHDPIIVPRAVVVVESMAAITIADALFANMSARLDRVVDFYKNV